MERIFLVVITSGLLMLGTAATILVAYMSDKATSLIRTPSVPSLPAKSPPPWTTPRQLPQPARAR